MTIHFVYVVPKDDLSKKIRFRIGKEANKIGIDISPIGRRDVLNMEGWPICAPFSITANVFNALKKKHNTLLYDWQEKKMIQGGAGDILLGHPSALASTIWNKSCKEGNFAARIALVPLSHHMVENCEYFEPYVPLVDHILGIMGPYWYDTWQNSALAHWKEKMTPVDLAINIKQFPRVKKRFNPPGKRKFLYIGRSAPMKGTHLLSILFGLAKEHQCVWIGSGPGIRNVKQKPWAELTPQYMKAVADECDFFITMGIADPNPTTILESMAWGFPVCSTPQSGYYDMKEITAMSITNMEYNLEVLNRMQYASEEELLHQADAARKLVEEKYTWNRFTDTIINCISKVAKDKCIDL